MENINKEYLIELFNSFIMLSEKETNEGIFTEKIVNELSEKILEKISTEISKIKKKNNPIKSELSRILNIHNMLCDILDKKFDNSNMDQLKIEDLIKKIEININHEQNILEKLTEYVLKFNTDKQYVVDAFDWLTTIQLKREKDK